MEKLLVNSEWIIPLFVYLLSLILKWFIYFKWEDYRDNLKIMAMDFALIGFALLLALLFKNNSQIIKKYPSSHVEIIWLMIFIYTLVSGLLTTLLNVHFKSTNNICKRLSLSLSYLLGYVLFIGPIRML